MNMQDVILAKRFGKELTNEQIRFFISGVTDRSIPDYQTSALLMAIVFQGMSEREMTDLTMAMAFSGDVCDLSGIPGTKIDKHSSGGVGDKCTLIVLPIVSSLGVPIAKLSGRGLGFTGGTIDKLESVRGFETAIPIADFAEHIRSVGMVLSGQTPELAPADKYLYALRDVTGTVQSIPLIASSIMSKKIAGGADAIVLDVTCGSGAFMKDEESARQLATAMIRIGAIAGRPVTCVISSMEQPLGSAIGNTMEVMEAVDVLQGKGPSDTREVSLTLAAAMLMRSDARGEMSFEKALSRSAEVIDNGQAAAAFSRFIRAQNGETDASGFPVYVDRPILRASLLAPRDGYITKLDALSVGQSSMRLGAGRRQKGDTIDMGAGIRLHRKIGDYVRKGDLLATFFTGENASRISQETVQEAVSETAQGYGFSDAAVSKPKEILAVLDETTI